MFVLGSALITDNLTIMAVILAVVVIGLYVQKYKVFSMIGPPITVIILSIILSNLKIVPFSASDAPIYSGIFQYAVPLSIAMIVLGVDLQAIRKLSYKPLLAILLAVLTVSVVAFVGGLIFAPHIEEGWKIAGMFVGTYTGGSSNLTAIATGLEATSDTIVAANAADYVIGIPSLILFFAMPNMFKRSKFLQKVWPHSLKDEELVGKTDDQLLSNDKKYNAFDVVSILTLGTIVVAIAIKIASYMQPEFQSVTKIISVTTLALIFSQFKLVKKLKGSADIGMMFGLVFLAVIGFMVSLNDFLHSTFLISVFCFFVIFFTIILHLILCRIFKVQYQYVILAIIAAISDGPTSSIAAGGAKWSSLTSVAIIMGVIGGILGNYVGFAVSYLIKFTLGL